MTKNHAGFFFLPVNIQQSSQLVYHSSDRHIADAPCRGDGRRGRRKRNKKYYHHKRPQREAPHGIGEAPVNEHVVYQPAQRQTDGAARGASKRGVCRGLRGYHFRHLPPIHAHGPHRAVLLHPCPYAHGNAVDDVQHRYQRDYRQKRIDAEHKGHVGSGCARLAHIPEAERFACGGLNGPDIRVRCAARRLHHHKGVILFPRQADKGLAGRYQRKLPVRQTVLAERVVFQQARYSKRFAIDMDSVAYPPCAVRVGRCQHESAVPIDLFQVAAPLAEVR